MNSNEKSADDRRKTNRLVARWLGREISGVVMTGAILFFSAGSLAWIWGWIMAAAVALWVGSMALVVIPRHPDLLAERLRPKLGTKTWDKFLMGLIGLVEIGRYLIAGLDERLGWTIDFPVLLQAGAVLPVLAGFGLVTWATGTNAFFSLNVRIQDERGHKVVSGGPYRYIRHPGYTGSILYQICSAVLLGSLWALIPALIGAAVIVVRTYLEDKTLQKELDGYSAYTSKVKYRLLPGVW